MMSNKIAVLPMDARPCSSAFLDKIGCIGGFRVLLPPAEWYPDFIRGCDTQRMARWAIETAQQVDCLIVSMDMLLFGGLAPAMWYQPAQSAPLERLAVLKEIRAQCPKLKLYAAFSVPGSSSAARSAKELVDRAQCMSYSQLSHKILLHGRDEDRQALDQLMEQIDTAALQDYLDVRDRAWQVCMRLLDCLEDGTLDFLSLGANDSSVYGLHRVRLQKLMEEIYRRDVEDRAVVYSGTDEQCQLLLIRAMQALQNRQVRFFPRYSCSGGELLVAPFEYLPLGDNLRLMMFAAGCMMVDTPAQADVILMVNTACQGWDDYREMEKAQSGYFLPEPRHNLWEFVSAIRWYDEQGCRVAVADAAFANGCDIGLVRFLERCQDLTRLTAFSGWNTAANTLGTAIAQAAARTLYQLSGREELCCECRQQEFLLERFADEYLYQVLVRPRVNALVEQKGGSVVNLEELYEPINQYAAEQMAPLLKEFFARHFQNRPLPGAFSGSRILSMQPRIRLPWARTFEIAVDTPFTVGP